jgi:hypothetical protein
MVMGRPAGITGPMRKARRAFVGRRWRTVPAVLLLADVVAAAPGTMWFTVDEAGAPPAYRWSDKAKLPTSMPIAIGRRIP